MLIIYDKETLKIIDNLNYTLTEFESNCKKCYPLWDSSKMAVSKIKYKYPKLDNGILREKTKEELKLEKIINLDQGEYIQDNKIIKIQCDDSFIKPVWDKETNIWIEGIKKEELTEMRKEKILNYENLKSEKIILENSEFSTTEEIETLNIELETLKNEINEIALKIKAI